MASHRHQAALDVYLLDLDATLRESERFATTIERTLTMVKPSSSQPRLAAKSVTELLTISVVVVAEARRLLDNVRESRDLLQHLQAECEKLRRD